MLITLLACGALVPAPAVPETTLSPCENEPRLHALDFWLGEWDVFVGERKVGSNRITKALDGCVVIESWRDVDGREGRSLFYLAPEGALWKQVWVTDRAREVGATKEKIEQPLLTRAGRIRFQGSYPGHDRKAIIQDRTTLTQNADGSLRQLIEISSDGGATWSARFDARYVRVSAPGSVSPD